MPPDDLYDRDFFLWTQAQAEALRAAGQGKRGSNSVEWERVAGEVEDLGESDLREARSYTALIIEHLFKLAWSRRAEPRGGWQAEIVRFRGALEDVLTASLRREVEADLERLHLRAAKAAVKAFESDEPGVSTDASLRWTLSQLLGEENDPIGRARLKPV